MEESYQIKVPLFEGPMDLLLHLIKENKLDIYDIPISLITHQYLEYLEMMKELDLEIAGEFLVMAATLIHIKSRMLLPIEETADTDEPEDPRMELVMKILEYKAYKEAALGLQEREDEWSEVFSRSSEEEEEEQDPADLSLFDLNLYDLISAFSRLLAKAPPEVRKLTKETLTIKDRMAMLIDLLQTTEATRFEKLFAPGDTISHFVVTFVALLELTRLGLAKIYQEKEFGSIWLISPEAEIKASELSWRAREDERLLLDDDDSELYRPKISNWFFRAPALPKKKYISFFSKPQLP
jgi:segregation and condensation protein A